MSTLGTPSSKVDPEVARFWRAVKLRIEKLSAGPGSSAGSSLRTIVYADNDDGFVGLPPAPTGLRATGAFSTIILEWDAPAGGVGFVTEVWRSQVDDLGTAVKVLQAPPHLLLIADHTLPEVSLAQTYYYWIRFRTSSGEGPFNAAAGTPASTASDPEYVLDLLAGEITKSTLHQALTEEITLTTEVADRVAQWSDQIAEAVLEALLDSDATKESEAVSREALAVKVRDNTADIVSINTVSADSDSAVAREIHSIRTAIDDPANGLSTKASITELNEAKSDIYGSSAEMFTGLSSTFSSLSNNIASKASITDVNTVLANTGSATATAVRQLVAGASVGGQTVLEIKSAVDAHSGQYTVKVDANGNIAGFGLMNDGATSLFEVVADRFAIVNASGSGTKVPFVVDAAAGVVMDTALIKDGTITSAKIASLAADKIVATSLSAISANMGNLTSGIITLTGPSSWIASSNYVNGVSGLAISGNGDAEFNSVYARGNIEATSLKAGSAIVDTLNISGQAITVPAFVANNNYTITLNYYIPSQESANYSVFIAGYITNTYQSSLFLEINGVTAWSGSLPSGSFASMSYCATLASNTWHTITYRSSHTGNINYSSLYAMAVKR